MFIFIFSAASKKRRERNGSNQMGSFGGQDEISTLQHQLQEMKEKVRERILLEKSKTNSSLSPSLSRRSVKFVWTGARTVSSCVGTGHASCVPTRSWSVLSAARQWAKKSFFSTNKHQSCQSGIFFYFSTQCYFIETIFLASFLANQGYFLLFYTMLLYRNNPPGLITEGKLQKRLTKLR